MRFKKSDQVVLSVRVPKSMVKAIEKNARRTNRYKVQVIKDALARELTAEDFGDGQGNTKA